MCAYKVKWSDMDPSVRLIGWIYRKILPYSDEKLFHHQNRLLDRFIKGHWFSRQTRAETITVKRPDGSELRLLVCRARNHDNSGKNRTGLLWIHGGGYAVGLPEQDVLFARMFCRDDSCIAVLPQYRRSLDAPYPAALDDCYQALEWMWKHTEELGINRDQIFVGGDSAGGGLTAALCLYARDKGEIPIAFQMPLYPMIDDRQITASSQDNDAPVWNTKSNDLAWKLYLGDLHGKEVPAYAAPSRAENLKGLPPVLTYVGTIEPFYDETKAFVEALKEAGVPVTFREFPGCFHGFDIIAYPAKAARSARKFLMENFRYAQEHYFASGYENKD